MEHWRNVLPPGTMLEVQYEQVVADVEGEARRIVSHCGLGWDDACLSFHDTERSVRTASAVQVRQPIYRSSIGRWRAYEHLLGPLIEALGVDLTGSVEDPNVPPSSDFPIMTQPLGKWPKRVLCLVKRMAMTDRRDLNEPSPIDAIT